MRSRFRNGALFCLKTHNRNGLTICYRETWCGHRCNWKAVFFPNSISNPSRQITKCRTTKLQGFGAVVCARLANLQYCSTCSRVQTVVGQDIMFYSRCCCDLPTPEGLLAGTSEIHYCSISLQNGQDSTLVLIRRSLFNCLNVSIAESI